MIGAIRRRFANSTEELWDADQEFKQEEAESVELHADAAVILTASQNAPGYFPGDESLGDYYKGIVRTAIENRGRYGDHWIPVPWLRMILAGLEYRHIDPDLLWYEADGGNPANTHAGGQSYEDLFPSEGGPAARMR